MAKQKKKYKYSRKKDGCTSAVITFCGVSLTLISEVQSKHRIATGRALSIRQAVNYIMNDYNILRNK